MNKPHLATYLNDHLAGASAALSLMGRLEQEPLEPAAQQALARLRAEIEQDRETLAAIMNWLGIEESRLRMAAGWCANWLAQAKLRLDDPAGGALRVFESWEALAVGIDGKRALWMVLAQVVSHLPELHDVDFEELQARAVHQRDAVESLRQDAARAALN